MASDTPPRDSERRQATVLYADISGFTALSERLDPEDVTGVMNHVFEVVEGIVVARGGIVNRYIGDCVMAVFGLMPGESDGPQRAVEAASEIRRAIHDLSETPRARVMLDVHVGIDSGPVIVGEIGGAVRREFTVMGDTVALAARLEDASGKGQIYVGPLPRGATADRFEYRRVEVPPSRPGTGPVVAWELVAEKPRRRRVKRDGERRQATVLFADVTGFGTLSERLPPDALTAVLNRCFALLESIVRGHGGVIDKYVGECVMALFGVPNAIENAPQQALNAAIEIRNRLPDFAREERLPGALDVSIGVNTGLVIAGEIGGRVKRDFTVMGDTVNIASRLKDLAHAGAIVVGPETHRYTREAFGYGPPSLVAISGRAEPVSTYELASEKQRVHRTRVTTPDRALASALVGRERELERLQACLARTVAGAGGVVSVVGEAGLGKSRLIAEALRFEPLRAATVLEGRSTSIGQNESFHPFVDLLRHWAGIADEDGEHESFEKLEHAVATAAPDEVGELLPFIATLMGMRLTGAHAERVHAIEGEALETLVLKNTRRLFQCLAAARPLVLVFEDLHWADLSRRATPPAPHG